MGESKSNVTPSSLVLSLAYGVDTLWKCSMGNRCAMSAVRAHISGKFSEMLNPCAHTIQSMDIAELERSAAEAKANGQKLKALAVINPGNPTGQCLPYANMVEVINFCEKEDIVLMADEVRFQTGEGRNEASATVRFNERTFSTLFWSFCFCS